VSAVRLDLQRSRNMGKLNNGISVSVLIRAVYSVDQPLAGESAGKLDRSVISSNEVNK
jgi:hypothetical protein